MEFHLKLTHAQMTVLSGMLDAAVKAIGIRALARDVVDLVSAIDAAEVRQTPANPEPSAAPAASGAPAQPELRIVQDGNKIPA